MICYLTGVSRWIGLLEVVSEPFRDSSPIWKSNDFPCRVRVKLVIGLTPETAVPIVELRNQLSIFQNLTSPFAWTGHLRGSPAKWKTSDGEVIVNALADAQNNPTLRPFDVDKLQRHPPILKSKLGPVTVPEPEEILGTTQETTKEATQHIEAQWLLLKLGSDMGLDVWVAQNDKGREMKGHKFSSIPRLKRDLPLQFDEVTNRTIKHIDVLWLNANAIVAAFEIECTTAIYSGLLRMSDLIAMQPNLNIPLYIVASNERRDKVIDEVNRPTFSRLSPPMKQMCRFISISNLRERVAKVGDMVRYLRPQFIEELSESCEIEQP